MAHERMERYVGYGKSHAFRRLLGENRNARWGEDSETVIGKVMPGQGPPAAVGVVPSIRHRHPIRLPLWVMRAAINQLSPKGLFAGNWNRTDGSLYLITDELIGSPTSPTFNLSRLEVRIRLWKTWG